MNSKHTPGDDRLSDFTRDARVIPLAAMAVVVGAFATVAARGLAVMIALATNVAFHGRWSADDAVPGGSPLGLLAVLIPAAGGLVVGLMARFGSDRIRGHGIPEALEAILIGGSRISPKVAILKPLSSAVSIGTGGPFGAEGPIIMTGGAIGSIFARCFHLTSAERKTLLVAGAAAGMTAVFSTPLAAVLLAVELLLFEWRPRSFIPVALAAATAALLRVPLFGRGPIFAIVPHGALPASGILAALPVGLAAGMSSGLLTRLVYGFEDLFERLPFHWMWWPVIGGLGVGAAGLLDPRILGVGMDTIRAVLAGGDAGGALALLVVVKALAWSFALGSGTSGGVLAPLLMMGAGIGSLASPWLPGGDRALWALVGMASMMGGTMRSPLTAIAFALELTHDAEAIPALLVACTAAHAVNVLLLRRSILTEKVARRGTHVAREYAVDPFALARVAEVMDAAPPLVSSGTTVAELAALVSRAGSPLAVRQGTIVVDEQGLLAGIVTRGDLLRAMDAGRGEASVLEAGTRDPLVATPDEPVHDALTRMLRVGVGRLPVVDRTHPRRVVGYLGRAGILEARAARDVEEHHRERGWSPERAPVGVGGASRRGRA